MGLPMYFAEFVKVLKQKRDSFLYVSVMLLFNIIRKQVHGPKVVIHIIFIGNLKNFFQSLLHYASIYFFLLTGLLDGAVAFTAKINSKFLKYCGSTIIFGYHLSYCYLICYFHCVLIIILNILIPFYLF